MLSSKKRSFVKFGMTLVLGVLIGSLATAGTGFSLMGPVKTVPVAIAAAVTEPAGEVSLENGFQSVVQKTLPAVVNVSSAKVVRSPRGRMFPFFFFGPFFDDQFQMPRERREQSLGSGVVVSSEGYLLTNHHVVKGAEEITVILRDERELEAELVGSDPKTDIAVLKVHQTDLPTVPLGDSDKVKVGEFALAIGNPFGVGQTVTLGIVGATGRSVGIIKGYEDFIQTDAAINPGNSGGALVNARGELIGINTAIIARGGGGNQGVGFAVPINLARSVMEQIIEKGRVVRGWLGVMIQPVDESMAKAFGLDQPGGALVSEVSSGSPAEKAGIRQGDVIIEFEGEQVKDPRQLSLKVSMTDPETTVDLTVFRDGSEKEISVTLGELPEDEAEMRGEGGGSTEGALSGVTVDELSPQLRRRLGLEAGTEGVIVVSVAPASAAAEAGLRQGDVIEQVNRTPVSNVAEFQSEVRNAGDDPILLLVNRGGRTSFVVVEPR